MILFRKILKMAGESRHPCQAPTVVLNHSPVLPLNSTALCIMSYRFCDNSSLSDSDCSSEPLFRVVLNHSSVYCHIGFAITRMFLSRKRLKMVSESSCPCQTPTVVLNHSPVLPLNSTALCVMSYRFCDNSYVSL